MMEWERKEDWQLVQEFLTARRDEAFTEIVRRYAPLVLGVCRRILGYGPDAEDAAQAVFLTLAHKAASLHSRAPLAGWLHKVARQISLDAKKRSAIRTRHERIAANAYLETTAEKSALAAILDEELNALPEKYRVPLLLHHVAGLTQEETAAALNEKVGTVSMQLNRAREMLKNRIAQGGLVLSVGVLISLMSEHAAAAQIPSAFVPNTAHAGNLICAGNCAAEKVVSTNVAALTDSALRVLNFSRLKVAAVASIAAVLLLSSLATAYVPHTSAAVPAQTSAADTKKGEAGQTEPKAERPEAANPVRAAALKRSATFLLAHQNADGSFGDTYRTAMSGLSTLALLSMGKTPEDKASGRELRRSIEYVLSQQKEDGYFGASDNSKMYGHAICTLMLSQAAQLTTDKDLREKILAALRSAVKLTLDAERDGHWRYLPTSTDGDLSVTGWQIVSLRGAAGAGVNVPEHAMKAAVSYVLKMSVPEGGFGYAAPQDKVTLRGLGVFALTLDGLKDEPECANTVQKIQADGVDLKSPWFYYRTYYSAIGMYSTGKDAWKDFSPKLDESLLSLQNEDGSFSDPPACQEFEIENGIYTTSLAGIILSLNEARLPVFKREK
jgi:RNA polymerase sigma factor (sigma-70 family)